MICVGIDIAKDKHDCCILDSDGTVRADCFTIPNNMDGFKQLLQTIRNCTKKSDKIKVGLEPPGITVTTFLDFFLTTVCQLMSLTLCTPTCTERVSAFAKLKPIVWMQERLQLCYCPM